ncbi:MAG: UDP-N-acetylmuramoyl-tripeptide--D-alanyl-D-alanine ligase [Actinomycetota bacterium]|nr:UDP-N-acetylmuramoyl-tripeptide--D-alanyl-D-alanine ligase [Actinomycetota bacterium]
MSDVARAVDGRLVGDDVEVDAVAIDSRSVTRGALFIALPGERTDGARFVPEATAAGARGVIVADGTDVVGPAVFVRSPGEALMRLAADERSKMDATVVGITGANGKTTTKDLTAAALASSLRTHASPGSFNNEIGLPVTLLTAPADTQAVVAEMGARHKGDVSELSAIARPNIVVVTNIGLAHIEIFGSWDAIVEASAEPVEAVGADGVAILLADDPVVAGYRSRCAGRVVTFGITASADVRAIDVRLGADGCPRFTVVANGETAQVQLSVPGEHMVTNALAAIAVGRELGVSLPDATNALAAARISRWRMETFTTSDGIRVVNDAYNANPESVAAAIKAARWMAGDAHFIAVLGPMAELGSVAMVEHERIGELAARVRVDRLITVGAAAYPIAVAGLREGVEPDNVATYDRGEEALADVRAHARPGDVVLFKASRVAGLEKLAEALR